MKERIKFLMQLKRCYGWLESMSNGDNAKTCTNKLMCSSCMDMFYRTKEAQMVVINIPRRLRKC